MTTVSDARRRFDYHAWATAGLAAAITDDPAADRACAILAHACTADSVWLRRIRGEDTAGTELWPSLEPAAVRDLASRNAANWDAFLRGLVDARLPRMIDYRTMNGDPYSTPLADLLEHVLFHGAYHRGQAAAALRAAGVPPPATDYVVWTRG